MSELPADDLAGKLARAYAPEAIAALVESVRQNTDVKARISAANALLDRGYGKSLQPVAKEPGARKSLGKLLADMSDDELLSLARKARSSRLPVIEGEGGVPQNGGPQGPVPRGGPQEKNLLPQKSAPLLPIANGELPIANGEPLTADDFDPTE